MTLLDTLCVELTTRCPLRCSHCSVAAGPERRDFLDLATFTSCLDQVRGLAEIYLSGGEPFDHPRFLDFVVGAGRSGAKVVVYSSGTASVGGALAPLSMDLLTAAAGAGMDRVDVSLYGTTPDLHDRVTMVPGSFAATLTTLRRLRMLGVAFGVHYVPVADNGDSVLSVSNLARSLGASRFHVLALAPQGRGRVLQTAPSPGFHDDVRELWASQGGTLKIVLSSRTRQAAGIFVKTERDSLRAAMLDCAGFLYPGEGKRQPELKTKRSLALGEKMSDLLAELVSG